MQKLTKKQTAVVYQQCFKLVKRKPPEFFTFKKMRRSQGICDYENDILEFDPRREFVRTAFHECVHYIYPDWSETKVLYVESRIINVCTSFEIARFLKEFTSKLYKAELIRNSLKKSKKRKKIN
jgi:hypothetical protein